VALVAQVSVLVVYAVVGVTDTAAITGFVLSTLALPVPRALPPSTSVAVAAQVSTSPGLSAAVRR
jgi:hypothetical protein